MTQTVSVDEAQNKLQDLLADALAEVIITEHGTPVTRLVPVMKLLLDTHVFIWWGL